MVADVLLRAHEADLAGRPAGFVDDNPDLLGRVILGIPVLGRISEIPGFDYEALIVAIGENRRRAEVFDQLAERAERMVAAVHPAAVVAPDVAIGEGVVICAGVVVNTGAVVSDGVILNSGCTVDHHCRIDAHSHIAPGAHLGGGAHVGEGALVGIGTSVLPGQSIGAWARVGAGAVVTRDIPAHATSVGVPARETGRRDGSED